VAACPQEAIELTPDGIVPTENPCLQCGRCTEECPATALEMSGRAWPMDELMAEVEKERGVMEDSGGGVTLCGGEPLMDPDYALQLLRELGRRGFHRTVDTTLFVHPDIVAAVAKECELFLVDLKTMDSEVHRKFTGVPNERILENIRLLSGLGARFFIRIPLIREVNAGRDNLEASARFLAALPAPPEEVDLLPYHDIGKGKHERMWSVYNPLGYEFTTPAKEEQEAAAELFRSHGLNTRIGG
jgi:pyruvate formate lyase activating enzyme